MCDKILQCVVVGAELCSVPVDRSLCLPVSHDRLSGLVSVLTMNSTKRKDFNPFTPEFTLSSSSTTSLELLSQFSTYSG